jgi:hypothetical protein
MDPQHISFTKRFCLWTGAWAAAAVATLVAVGAQNAALAFLFPAGLLIVVPDGVPNDVGLFLFFLTYFLYGALTIVGLCQNRRVRFYFSFGILCALLALNVTGCHMQVNSFHPGC